MTPDNRLIKYLAAQSKVLISFMNEVPDRLPGKVVHQVRLATRRARAALWVLRHCSSHIRFKGLNKELQRLGDALGRIRELDVAILDAKRFGFDSSTLVAGRKEAHHRLRHLIHRDQKNELALQLWIAGHTAREIFPVRIDEAKRRLDKQLASLLKRRIHGQTKFHQLRIVIKKTRYALEAMGKPIGSLQRLQDILGEAHDLELLQTLLGKDSTIRAKQRSLNDQAIRMIEPALRFAAAQLRDSD